MSDKTRYSYSCSFFTKVALFSLAAKKGVDVNNIIDEALLKYDAKTFDVTRDENKIIIRQEGLRR